ncbi:DUF5718 family protein [Endozoicomonas sp. 8E]|uniref:DUF5718 family protein n=1 Tax=Endozoicomonas sp. 8E TaxID=3035692 RepID=UPI00293920AD|nr:DUF5718 family protein [Endozoicomonas sp. 8E]WOG28347.1 DUF5718 family protein [Endozoicomonas sp. 8E]
MPYRNMIGLGVAGNFAGHLEQAGEASDFQALKVSEDNQPKAIFPFYVPSENSGFLSTYPLSNDKITMPETEGCLQIEPEVALICNIEYALNENTGNRVVADLIPKQFAAYNDCSIRKPNAHKISEKKNWGAHTKGIASTLLELDTLQQGGTLDRFRIASYHKKDGNIFRYGEDSPTLGYSYFHQKLLDWIIDRMNHQQDNGPAEDIASLLAKAEYPEQALISIGATRYTEYGESHFLQSGDTSIVVVYDGELFHEEEILEMAALSDFSDTGISALIQRVC